jgi:protoporphyrinogen oxidase
MKTLDIIGGGILGLAMGYDLQRRGYQVRIWERAAELGGLMGRSAFPELNNLEAERYYHAILSSDQTLMQLIEELGLKSALHGVTTKMGFYHDGKMFPMSNPIDFLQFPPLSMLDRFRLGLTILSARRVKNWRELEEIPVLEWLTKLGGKRTVEHIWKPLLRAKFDGGFEKVPATYIWSRLVRVTDARGKSGATEQMCFLTGGYIMLINALADAIRKRGGEINLGTTIEQVCIEDNQVVGLQIGGNMMPSEGVVITMQTPIARRLLPPNVPELQARWSKLEGYLGIVCMLLVLKRSLTPYYTLNITDERIPFTGVIETTNLIDRQYSGGYHLVYLPKYVSPDNPFAKMDDSELRRSFLGYLRQMFPDFRDEDIAAIRIGRERFVEPLHPVGQTDDIPPIIADVDGLYLVNSSQIYPQLTNGEAAVAYAYASAERIAKKQREVQTRQLDPMTV